jgi:hypothetical protein
MPRPKFEPNDFKGMYDHMLKQFVLNKKPLSVAEAKLRLSGIVLFAEAHGIILGPNFYAIARSLSYDKQKKGVVELPLTEEDAKPHTPQVVEAPPVVEKPKVNVLSGFEDEDTNGKT